MQMNRNFLFIIYSTFSCIVASEIFGDMLICIKFICLLLHSYVYCTVLVFKFIITRRIYVYSSCFDIE